MVENNRIFGSMGSKLVNSYPYALSSAVASFAFFSVAGDDVNAARSAYFIIALTASYIVIGDLACAAIEGNEFVPGPGLR
jgi:hypothetical protein